MDLAGPASGRHVCDALCDVGGGSDVGNGSGGSVYGFLRYDRRRRGGGGGSIASGGLAPTPRRSGQ